MCQVHCNKPRRLEKIFQPVMTLGLTFRSSNVSSARDQDDIAGAGPRFFEENPRELFIRTWQQQVAREYHSQLSEGWWVTETSRDPLRV